MTAQNETMIDGWEATRDTIHAYSQILGNIRKAYSLPEKHWWHISLRPVVCGWTTTLVPIGGISAELTLDLIRSQLTVQTDRGADWQIPLKGQSTANLYNQLRYHFAALGVELEMNTDRLTDDARPYDWLAARQLWKIQLEAVTILQHLRTSFRQESSPIQLWPHHFDISLVWLSGRLIEGQDPADAEHADEQMSFGFGTGDSLIDQPYFYANAYPMPEDLRMIDLPAGYWPVERFGGALLIRAGAEVAGNVLNFFETIHQAGRVRMLS